MILFVIGFVLGGVLVAVIVSVYLQHQIGPLRRDRAFLWARLRSLMQLADAGLLHAESVDAADALAETRDLVREKRAVPVPRSALSDESQDVDDDVPPLFPH